MTSALSSAAEVLIWAEWISVGVAAALLVLSGVWDAWRRRRVQLRMVAARRKYQDWPQS